METVKELRKILKEYYDSKEKGWWNKSLKWLKETYGFPKIYPIPKNMQVDYHPVFRDLLYSPFPIPENGEGSATNRLVAFSRKEDLFNMRILPHYFGIFDPFYSSRSVNNFGLVNMVVDKKHGKGIFSRATLNCPYFFKQKIKRMIIEAYGVSKNGKPIDNIDDYPKGGLFLINPDKNEKWEKLTPYCDYSYVELKVRLPKNYKEFVQTIDGSVLISKSAKKKLQYVRKGYAIIRNPHPKITKKILFFKKTKIPSEGAFIKFQEPLSVIKLGKTELPVQTSPVEGYITKVELLTPQIKDEERKIWKLEIEDIRDAELGLKLESPTGLKCTIAGYTNDKEPTIVINPDQLKDRSMYWEIKDFGCVHCYPAVAGIDGNISNKDVKISKTLLQGLFCYPPKIRNKLIEEIFSKENLSFSLPNNIIEILENLHKIPPDKLIDKYPIFFPYLYYIRRKKMPDGSIRFYEEPTQAYRALKELQTKSYDELSTFYKNALDNFVNTIIRKILICDSNKASGIKIKGYLRIVLFDDLKINEIKISKDLWEQLGKPEYVIIGKEPISRPTSLRCMKVIVDKKLQNQVVKVNPYFGKDYDDPDSFNTKCDTDGDLLIIIPIKNQIDGAMYPSKHKRYKKYYKKWKKYKTVAELPQPPYNYKLKEIITEIYDYQRLRSLDQLCVQELGGIKNRAMFTNYIKDYKEWSKIVEKYDIEYVVFQAEKQNPELKDASYWEQGNYRLKILKEARKEGRTKFNKLHPDCELYYSMESFGYKDIPKIKQIIKQLKKSDHPLMQLFYYIYKQLDIVPKSLLNSIL